MKTKTGLLPSILLAGAAALALSTAGYAAGDKDKQMQDKQTQSQPMKSPSGSSTTGSSTTTTGSTAGASSQLALQGEKLVGKTVYGANNQEVGEIDNVVMGQDKKVSAVLVDVGGFLGIGSKTVALPIAQLQPQGERIVASALTKEEAKSMPEYTEKDKAMQNRAGQSGTSPSGTSPSGTMQKNQSRTQ